MEKMTLEQFALDNLPQVQKYLNPAFLPKTKALLLLVLGCNNNLLI